MKLAASVASSYLKHQHSFEVLLTVHLVKSTIKVSCEQTF